MSHTPGKSIVFVKPQIGVETVAGTLVPATKRLQSTVRMRPQIPTDPHRPSGSRFPTDSTPQKGQSTGTIESGRINLGGDVLYWLSSLLGATAASSGSWLWKPDAFTPEALTTFSLERGIANGEKVPFVVCDSLEFEWSRTAADVRGTLLGQALTSNQAMTSGLPSVGKALAIPGKVKVEVGSASDSLTKLTNCLQTGFSIRGAHRGKYTLDEDSDSYSGLIALAPTMAARIVVENDSVAAGYLNDLKSSTMRFLQITSYGPLGLGEGGADRYFLRALMPFKFAEADLGETEDVDSGIFDLLPIWDEEFEGAMEIEVYTNATGL